MKVREQVVAAIDSILEGKGKPVRPWADSDPLLQATGMDSLDLAVLVVTLEADLGVDPFRDGRSAVRTIGELVATYESAIGASA